MTEQTKSEKLREVLQFDDVSYVLLTSYGVQLGYSEDEITQLQSIINTDKAWDESYAKITDQFNEEELAKLAEAMEMLTSCSISCEDSVLTELDSYLQEVNKGVSIEEGKADVIH